MPNHMNDQKNYQKEVIMIPAGDGARLKTIIYKPADNRSSWPCVVERSPYQFMLGFADNEAVTICGRGYAYVLQLCRGRLGSEGEWEPNVHERADGLSLLRFLTEQPWVENMGYKGLSYMALCGWVMADAVPEKLKSMALANYGCDRFTSAYSGGLFRHDILTGWTMENAAFPITADYKQSCLYRPHLHVDTDLWGGEVPWYREWISNPDNENGYWDTGFWAELRDVPSKIHIPIYLMEGWFDHHLESALQSFARLPDATKAVSVLEVGPWNHIMLPAIDGYADAKNTACNRTNKLLDWFDLTVKQAAQPEGEIRFYRVGADRWETAAAYPFPVEPLLRLGLDVDSGSKVLKESTSTAGTVSYTYNPNDPVPTIGAEALLTTAEQRGSKQQPESDYRSDVCSFLSPPLEKALDVRGRVKVRLCVASNAEDTAFCAKLCEVMPNGKAYNLRTMISSLAYRNGAEHRTPYTPGQFVELELESWDISWRFQKGSQIRLDLSSSDFPQYAAHPNSSVLWCEAESAEPAHQTVECSRSFLLLPLG